MLDRKRDFPPVLLEAIKKIEQWRAALVRKLHERPDVIIYLLTAKVYYTFFAQFAIDGFKANPQLEHYVRNELFGLQFALSTLNEPLPQGIFQSELIDSILTSKDGQQAEKVINSMSSYSHVRDAWLTYSWGGYEIENPQENVIRFIDSPDWLGHRDQAQRILGQVAKVERAEYLITNTVISPPETKLTHFIDIPMSLPLGGLNANQFFEAWLASGFRYAQRCLYGQNPVIKKSTFIKLVQDITSLKLSEAERFVNLITFEANDSSCLTLFHCPLVPVTTSSVAIVPQGFIFGNPNTCIPRLAVHRGQGLDHFANEISKYFLGRLTAHYNSNDVTICTNRHYTGSNTSGDIDLIVFENKTKRLLIAEVKGFVHPDSAEEVIRANEKLQEGIEQIVRIKKWLEGLGPSSWGTRLGLSSLPSKVDIEFAVIGNGFAGSDYLRIPSCISVVDAEYLLIPKFRQESIFDVLHEYQKRLTEEIIKADRDRRFASVKLAGITFELPSWIAVR
jgi:hypothetical protein